MILIDNSLLILPGRFQFEGTNKKAVKNSWLVFINMYL